jgi:hypothetical protein
MRRITIFAASLSILAACSDATVGPDPSITPQSPSRNRVTVLPDGKMVAPDLPGFVEHARLEKLGSRNAKGACVIQESEQLSPGQRVAFRIVEFDPKTCGYTVARGDLTRAKKSSKVLREGGATYDLSSGQRTESSVATGAEPITALLVPPTPTPVPIIPPPPTWPLPPPPPPGYTVWGFALQDIYAYDPFGLTLNEDDNQISYGWNTGTGCMVSASGYHRTYWLSYDGWYQRYSYAFGQGLSCQSAGGVTTSGYTNPIFCNIFGPMPGGITDVDYTSNSITVHPGYTTFVWFFTYGGGCTDFLGFAIERAA